MCLSSFARDNWLRPHTGAATDSRPGMDILWEGGRYFMAFEGTELVRHIPKGSQAGRRRKTRQTTTAS